MTKSSSRHDREFFIVLYAREGERESRYTYSHFPVKKVNCACSAGIPFSCAKYSESVCIIFHNRSNRKYSRATRHVFRKNRARMSILVG